MVEMRLMMRARLFLPTPSARRATAYHSRLHPPEAPISTHALREEGDVLYDDGQGLALQISTHALREEGDTWPPRPSTTF